MEACEEINLVRVRAQVMCRDETTGGWVPLGDGGLANVMVRKQPRPIQNCHHDTAAAGMEQQQVESGSSASSNNSKHSRTSTPKGHHPLESPARTHRPTSSNASGSECGETDTSVKSNNNSLPALTCAEEEVVGHKKATQSPQDIKYDYIILGKRVSDQETILSCTIKKDFQYNKVMPTFHHWVTGEQRFGLTFNMAADARAFDKGVRCAIDEMLDGLGGAWPPLRIQKKIQFPVKEDEKIFECLHLPTDSRSSSENSTASLKRHSRHSGHEDFKPIFNVNSSLMDVLGTPIRKTHTHQTGGRTNQINGQSADISQATKEFILKQKLEPSYGDDAKKMAAVMDHALDADNYSYVQLTAAHEYMYPHLGPEGPENRSPISQQTAVSSNTTSQSTKTLLDRKDSVSSVKKNRLEVYSTEADRIMNVYQPARPVLQQPKKKGRSASTAPAPRIKQRCRYCQEWYLERSNKSGCCEEAPDTFKSCIDGVSMMKCAQCLMYHCMSDSEGEFSTNPCECIPREDGFAKRWFGLTLLSLLVPCLCLYPPLRAVHACCSCCGLAGGKHAPLH